MPVSVNTTTLRTVAERDRRDDRHRRRHHRADGGQDGGDAEHDPRDQRHPPAHGAHRGVHQPVDGAVVVGDREQVGDTDEDDEQITREAGEDVVLGDPHRAADDERRVIPGSPMLIGRTVPMAKIATRTRMDVTAAGDHARHPHDRQAHARSDRLDPDRMAAPDALDRIAADTVDVLRAVRRRRGA
jgi:hypothetical protein